MASLQYGVNHDSTFMEKVKFEFFRFCQSTTIRGVSRIVNARRKSIRILWSIFVFLLIIGLTACLVLLTRTYLDYNVIHPPRVLRDEMSPFPSLTLCNLRPISKYGHVKMVERNLRNPREFMKNYQNYTQRMFSGNYPEEASNVFSLGSYIESIPKDLIPVLAQNITKQVYHCKTNYLDNNIPKTVNCDTVGSWIDVLHPLYLNCGTLNFNTSFGEKVRSIELFMYLNESQKHTECIDCLQFEIKSQLSGAAVVLHNSDTYPDIDFDSIYIQPGTLTEIKIRTFLNIQKEPPYGRCSQDTPHNLFFNNHNFTYSETSCKKRVKQLEINNHCNCSAIEFPLLNDNLNYCMNISLFTQQDHCVNYEANSECTQVIKNIIENIKCKTDKLLHFSKDVIDSCSLPCSFYSYESDRSTSTWPTKSHLSNLIKYLKNRASDLLNPEELGDDEDLEKASALFEKNALAIMLIKPNFNVQKVEEKEVISLTSFLSQTGGLLSIWIGLSMICVVEVIELLINILELLKKGKKNISSTNSSPPYQNPSTFITSGYSEEMERPPPDQPPQETSRMKEFFRGRPAKEDDVFIENPNARETSLNDLRRKKNLESTLYGPLCPPTAV